MLKITVIYGKPTTLKTLKWHPYVAIKSEIDGRGQPSKIWTYDFSYSENYQILVFSVIGAIL